MILVWSIRLQKMVLVRYVFSLAWMTLKAWTGDTFIVCADGVLASDKRDGVWNVGSRRCVPYL